MRKKASVRRTFYRSFCLLIVLPLVAVAAAGSALLYRKLLADAREMVQMRQEAVSSALTQDVRQASLQLAHFLLSEDSEGLALVDELPASSSRRYETAARLESIFDYYRLTGRRLEALHLYLTDGTSYQLYTGLAVPQNRVKEAAWYRAARQRPGEVCVGVAEPGTLLSGKNRRGDLLLTAALQVEPGYGGSALEVACLYFETDAEEMLESYNSEAGAVRMALALDGAFLAGDEALAPAVERSRRRNGLGHRHTGAQHRPHRGVAGGQPEADGGLRTDAVAVRRSGGRDAGLVRAVFGAVSAAHRAAGAASERGHGASAAGGFHP